MSFSIQTNVNSLIAQENLRVNSNFQSQTIQRLTSGYRINQSGDDAAGLAVANKFRSDISELSQGVRNANDGVSQLQIIDGGMNNISKMLDRLKTLATQSASDSFTGDRSALNSEYQTLASEIDRQAQTIGLNVGGGFAKSLSVYIGGGTGATSSAVTANGVVSVDLSKSTVDTQSLGLKGIQVGNTGYDLGSASTTSVQALVADTANAASLTSGYTKFTFFGPGFAADATTANKGIDVSVNMSSVGDTTSLVSAINAAIDTAGQGTTGAAAAFAKAGIKATIVTDSTGKQQLAFTSSNTAFEVQADDKMSNALMGNFDVNGLSGRKSGTGVAANTTYTAGTNTISIGSTNTLTFSGLGLSSPVTITLASQTTKSGTDVQADIAAKIAASGLAGLVTVSTAGGQFSFAAAGTAAGTTFSVSAQGLGADLTALGFTTVNGATTSVTAGTSYSAYSSGGAYELATTASDGTVTPFNLNFATLTAGSQAITVAANDSSGNAHPLTVNLNAASTTSIDAAVNAINDALQKSNDATLQTITAVKTNTNGRMQVNFVSTTPDFTVSIGTTTNASEGLYATPTTGITATGTTLSAKQVGDGGVGDISTASRIVAMSFCEPRS